MNNFDHIKPKTLDGIKRLAKQLKKQNSIPNYIALNKAAQQSGFNNYKAAQAFFTQSATGLIT